MAMIPTMLFSFCSLLMASMFAYSASVQLNDPDWYFWFPLYAFASMVNLLNWKISYNIRIRHVANLALLLGIFLFFKILLEICSSGTTIAGFLSLDLNQRLVREKTGSGLVVISMILHIKTSSPSPNPKQPKLPRFVEYGMAGLVGFSYGFPFFFFAILKKEMKL
ncbi:uncharacterized protein LOC110820075 isoform X1 [Carica papaya]|uniref:uncharacterized protein LOC110820075 isoform X1 n=1 Tax=Carica papaya TaxID=3649 RepID=UPI000B8C8959|nr:uncharacterized protein LOC110820075 isoform X1 [Carica papaya]